MAVGQSEEANNKANTTVHALVERNNELDELT